MTDIKAIAEALVNLTTEEVANLAETLKNEYGITAAECVEKTEEGMTFGAAIEAMKAGKPICRRGWNGKGMFVIKQVPAHITEDIIPKMQSLPQSAKDILMSRENPHIDYTNQLLLIQKDGCADSWTPSSSDVLAEDWMVYVEPKEKEE